jgi:hypothetical protein
MGVATDEVRQLIAELDVALAGNYLPEQHHAVSLEQLFGGRVVALVGAVFWATMIATLIAVIVLLQRIAEHTRDSARSDTRPSSVRAP